MYELLSIHAASKALNVGDQAAARCNIVKTRGQESNNV